MLQSEERVNTTSTNKRKSFLKSSSLFLKENFNETLKSNNQSVMNDINTLVDDKLCSSIYLKESGIKEIESSDSKFELDNNFDLFLKPGDIIYNGSIVIIKMIGQGGQATVYLGEIKEIKKFVAVKHYQKDINEEQKEIQKIKIDIEKLKKLKHNNIVYYYDLEIEQKGNICNIYIIMEYLETNLEDFIAWYKEENKVKYLPLDLVSYISRNIVQGLAYLHQNKIINRDLKPENILLNKNLSDIKITDFGISTKVKDSKTFIKRTNSLGTPFYISPDVLFDKPYSYDCDIWSLGCVVFELVSGEKPHIKKVNPNGISLTLGVYSSPLETADDDVLDIIYDRKNRILLDFLQKCWRGNNKFRPSAKELLKHKFLEIKDK